MEVILFSLGSDPGSVTQQLDISPNTHPPGKSLCSTVNAIYSRNSPVTQGFESKTLCQVAR